MRKEKEAGREERKGGKEKKKMGEGIRGRARRKGNEADIER